MNIDAAVTLSFAPGRTLLRAARGGETTLAIGPDVLATQVFRHDPPTSAEVERAIDLIEEALMASALPHAPGRGLQTGEAVLRAYAAPGERSVDRAQVEGWFDRLAAAAQGLNPAAAQGLPTGPHAAAALVILRECMHHLGFARLHFVPPITPDAS